MTDEIQTEAVAVEDDPASDEMTVAGIRFNPVGKLYHFDYRSFPDLKPGEFVIVETMRGRQMGQVMGFAVPDSEEKRDYLPIMRRATPRDLVLRQHWEQQEPEALQICQDKADEIGKFRNVKFVAAQYNYDGSSLTFMYTAEDKVNVGTLWKALGRMFDAKVEMRQIGPRDVAKLLGGYGACGELRCCSTFLTDFSPISIKMAKAQGISLNPSEITGMCGRLRCCLVYEYEEYVKARKQLPKRNKRVGTPFGAAKVIDVHPLQDAVTVITDEGRHLVQREDIIPLDEWEALQKKAQEPCSKHGDEPCDCGKPPGERMADQVAEPEAKAEAPQSQSQQQPQQQRDSRRKRPEQKEGDDEGSKRKRSRRGRGRRNRGRGKGRRGNSGDQQNNQPKNQNNRDSQS